MRSKIVVGDSVISLDHNNAYNKLVALNPGIEVQDFIALKHPAVKKETKVGLLRLILPKAELWIDGAKVS